ncbi:N(6)-adenine-specific methyltransferase METTL4 isoform X2 [Venturia canescens]|uniref:N(6)-adenine-specific methyltransferase METTL4 isoform X2 n=1 Tax=Venturia canescens TaxID=32260 RepID=UPI001C9CA728|nr:N(6)-adenine-specific methyltransferase METTL4 isoform X2 [Venturia canescens]
MSILLSTEDGWILSHLQYLNEIYKNVINIDKACNLKFDERFFAINSQFLRNNQVAKSENGALRGRVKKRKKLVNSSEDLDQVNFVRDAFMRMRCLVAAQNVFNPGDTYDNNQVARTVSDNFYSGSALLQLGNFHGANDNENPIVVQTGNQKFVFPKRSFFYAYDVKDIFEKLGCEQQYDFILMDPPWWNKFVRRKKEKFVESSMMYNEELEKMPIENLLGKNGIVAVWCTNAPSHLNSILNEMFPAWGIVYVGKWYWVKVTQSGNTVCEFNFTNEKQPYEILIFGRKILGNETKIPDKKLIVSVPSCVHSHKPPINEIMRPYLVANPKCLEIFARYLLPNWTSWGLEVLKFQHLSLYEIVEPNGVD